MRVSNRAEGVALSITLALDARAKELAAGGRDVVNMAVGEPDAPAPAAAQAAAVAKVQSGNVRYTPAAGTGTLRAALARHLSATRSCTFEAEQVIVCHSGKHALSGACMALFDPGDELLIPQPAWVSYVEIARVTGLTPVAVAGRADCGPDLDALAAARTDRARGILINSPSNPSGYVWSREELAALDRFAAEHDLWVISDEIYRRLVYGERPFVSPVDLGPEAAARTLIVDGASKAYAMTGYRIGFAAGPAEAIRAMARVQSQLTGSPNAVSQAAYEAALDPEPPEVAAMVTTYARRRKILVEGLEQLGFRTPAPFGAFYAFPDVTPFLDGADDSGDFCARLLEEEGVVLVPGAAFGAPRHVRLSYALDESRIAAALERLARFIGA